MGPFLAKFFVGRHDVAKSTTAVADSANESRLFVEIQQRGLLKLTTNGFLETLLEFLRIKHAPPTSILSRVGNMNNLKSLEISYSSLIVLPENIAYLENLKSKRIDLSFNNIRQLPASVGILTSLIPESIGKLRQFADLALSDDDDADCPPMTPEEAYDISLSRSIGNWTEGFRNEVASMLSQENMDGSSWEGVARKLKIDENKINNIRERGNAHRLFFHELRVRKPYVTLSGIKDNLEKLKRNDVFYEHEKDTKFPALDTTIGSLNGSKFEYFLKKIADKLTITASPFQVNWRGLGGEFGFTPNDLDVIETRGKPNTSKCSARLLVDLIASNGTNVETLINVLEHMGINDVRELIKERLKQDDCWNESCPKMEDLAQSDDDVAKYPPLSPGEAYDIGLSRSVGSWTEAFRNAVASMLIHENLVISCWEGVARELNIDDDAINKMKERGDAHRLLFHELRVKKPNVTLRYIKDKLEKIERNDVFYEHEKDTKFPALDATIGSLNESEFEYFLEKIADKLTIAASPVQVNWRGLGGEFFTPNDLDVIETRGNPNTSKCSARLLMDLIASNGTNVETLINALQNVERNDVKEFIKKSLKQDDCWDESCAEIDIKNQLPLVKEHFKHWHLRRTFGYYSDVRLQTPIYISSFSNIFGNLREL